MKKAAITLIIFIFAGVASARNNNDQYDYEQTIKLFKEVDKLNPTWHLGQKVNIPSEFYKESFKEGLELNLFGFSDYAKNIILRPTFKEAFEEYYPGRSQFGFYVVNSIINEDTNGKFAAAAVLVGVTRGLGALGGAVARFGIWANRAVQGMLYGAPIVAASVAVHEANKDLKKVEDAHPKIRAAETQVQRDEAVDEVMQQTKKQVEDSTAKSFISDGDDTIRGFQERLKFAKTPEEVARLNRAIAKTEGLKRDFLSGQGRPGGQPESPRESFAVVR